MPIGKNALKRVSNNGYSALKSAAPDMENSEVVVKTEQEQPKNKPTSAKSAPKTKIAKPEEKPAAKKSAPLKKADDAKKAPAKVKAEKPVATKVPKVEETAHPDGFIRTALGDEMPVYLL